MGNYGILWYINLNKMKCIEIFIKYFWFYSKLYIMNGYDKLFGVLYDRFVEVDDMDLLLVI